MSKEYKLFVGDGYCTYQEVVESLEGSESFRLNFADMMFSILLEMNDLRKIHDLNLVPDMAQLMHFREHFIESLYAFYMYEKYDQKDFDLMCSWQELVKELLLGIEKGVLDNEKEVQA